jgi:hypothetical protein
LAEPPLIATGQLRNGGVGVRILFSHATNKADARSDDRSCSLYFTSESVLSLGTFPSCLWSDDLEMLISFGNLRTLQVGQFLHFRADSSIKSASKASLLAVSKVALEFVDPEQ